MAQVEVQVKDPSLQTSSRKQMTHHCGLVIENVLKRDEGTWQCNLDLLDVTSNFQRFKKVIDLKVIKRTQSSRRHRRNQGKRRRNQFSLYGGYGDEYGSGDGSGDGGEEVSRGVPQRQ